MNTSYRSLKLKEAFDGAAIASAAKRKLILKLWKLCIDYVNHLTVYQREFGKVFLSLNWGVGKF